jgi:hypothetical protein
LSALHVADGFCLERPSGCLDGTIFVGWGSRGSPQLPLAALAATRGNQIRAADLLGLNRNTLRKKIRDLDIQVYRSGA